MVSFMRTLKNEQTKQANNKTKYFVTLQETTDQCKQY
jgi:hypothetical protein